MLHISPKDPAQAFEDYAAEVGAKAPADWPDNVLPFPIRLRSCLDAALDYVMKYGWASFPARMENGKKYSWLWAGHAPGQDENWGATRDPEQLRKNFSNSKYKSKCGVGIPCGIDNDIFDIEVDTLKGHDKDGLASLQVMQDKYGELPPTLMQESPSGSVHRIYKHPGNGIKIKNGDSIHGYEGVDCLGDGGMFIAAPSRRADGCYRWTNNLPIADAPAWLLDLVSEDGGGDNITSPYDPNDPYLSVREPVPIDKIAFMLNIIPNPDLGWDEWNEVGMATWAGAPDNDGFTLFDAWSQKSAKYHKKIRGKTGKQRTAAKWKKYLKNPPTKLTVGKLFHLADEADENWRKKYDAEQRDSKGEWPKLGAEALHGLAGKVVEVIGPHSESDPVALLLQFLVYFGNAIGRGIYWQIEGTKHYTNLNAVLVGSTGKSRKGTSGDRIRQVMSASGSCTAFKVGYRRARA
jgi:hypothetical protein